MTRVAVKILLVEDDVLLVRALSVALEAAGYRLVVARSVEEAAREVLADETIDLVLVDRDRIPVVGGDASVEKILARRSLPVVCLACHAGWEVGERNHPGLGENFCVQYSGDEVLLSFLEMTLDLFNVMKQLEFHEASGFQKNGPFGCPEETKGEPLCFPGSGETAPEAVWRVDMDTQCFVYISPAAAELWGCAPEIMLEKPVETFFHTTQGGVLRQLLREHRERQRAGAAAEGVFWAHEVEQPCEEGLSSWYEVVFVSRHNAVHGHEEILGAIRSINHVRRLEKARRESEERFRRASALISDVIYSCKKDECGAYSVDWITGKPERICGYGAKEIMSRSCWCFLVLDEDLPLFNRHVLQVAPGNRASCELRLRHRHGGVVWVASHVECVASSEFPGQRVLYGVLVDITDRKRVEGALRESEAKHRHLFETMSQGVVYQDAEGHIVAANPAAERILGISLNQMRGKTSLDPRWRAVREDGTDLPGEAHPAMRALKTGRPVGPIVMGIYHWAQDACVWLSVTATPLFRPEERLPFLVHAVFEDITERKRAETALVESERRFKALHEASFGGVVLHDQGVVLDCNQALVDMTGYDVEELVGREFLKVLVAEEWREDVARRVEEGDRDPYETKILRKGGIPFPACVQGKQIPYQGRLVRVAEIRDITEQKQAREAIQALLREKEILLAEVHHRVKNNLNVVASMLSLQRSHVSCSEAVTALHDAESRVRSMMVLYDMLRQRGVYGEVLLSDYLEPLARLVVGMFPHAGTVRLETHIDPVCLETKTVFSLGIIVNELLTNVMKYAFVERDGGVVSLAVARQGELVIMKLRDNGQGMPQEMDLSKSAGFGLQMVSLLVSQIGGTLSVEREQGTCFVLTFPFPETSSAC